MDKLIYTMYRTDKNNEPIIMMSTYQYPIVGDYIEFQGEDKSVHALFVVDKIVRYHESPDEEAYRVYVKKIVEY